MSQCSECGEDYIAIVAIGVKILVKDFYRTTDTKHRGCNHPVQDTPYCPQCGQQMWLLDRPECVLPCPIGQDCHRPYKVEDAAGHKYHVIRKGPYCDSVIVATDFAEAGGSLDWESNPILLHPIPPVKSYNDPLKDFLEAYGLWDQNNFGIWCVLYCSD